MPHLASLWAPALIATALLTGCVAGLDPAPTHGGANVEVHVAPLELDSVSDADWRVAVTNGQGEVVWEREVSSSRFGDSAGAISVVGPCDAGAPDNTVEIELLALHEGAALVPEADYINPGPLARGFTCEAQADVAVTFDVSVVRRALQGFFDVAVSFEDLFCSAKLDCVDEHGADLELLHNPNAQGQRDLTAVVGFACTASPGSPTYLYMDDLQVHCDDPSFDARIDVSAQGAVDLGAAPSSNPGAYLFGASVFRGVEAIGDKAYWNTALGLDASRFAQAGSCTLSGRATASSEPFPQSAQGFPLPEATVYPVIEWNVTLSTAAGRECTSHEVNAPGSGVETAYLGYLPAPNQFTWSASPIYLTHRFERATGVVLSAADPECSPACVHGVCVAGGCDCAGTGYEGPLCATDVDECVVGNGGCGAEQVCVNQLGGPPVCECPGGYRAVGEACVLQGSGTTCAHILADDPAAVDGMYEIDPDGPGGAAPYEAYCDMSTAGGGWTLVNVKQSVQFVPWSSIFDASCGASLDADCASAIDPALSWTAALWRFAGDEPYAVRWERAFDTTFAAFLGGTSAEVRDVPMEGFSRIVDGNMSAQGRIDRFYYTYLEWVSEHHLEGSDRVLDLWSDTEDPTPTYLDIEDDNTTLGGRKCIAGYCRQAASWMMVRDASVCGAACGQAPRPPSCAAALGANPGAPSGLYEIDPDGVGGHDPFDAWCDMTTEGGGWTLVAVKTSPELVFWSGAWDPSCASQTSGDCASAIHPDLAWTTAMWRFASSDDLHVTWSRALHDDFAAFLMGAGLDVSGTPVGGWRKQVSGTLTGMSTITELHFRAAYGLSEAHTGSDQWIDLWPVQDLTENYAEIEGGDSALAGRKCLAGYCRSDTILLMVRDATECGAACGYTPLPRSCAEVLDGDPASSSGVYTIDPDGDGAYDPYDVYCDMTTEGGGWTLINTRVDPGFANYIATVDRSCGQATGSDCASAIPPGLPWTQALWRFSTTDDYVVFWERSANASFAAWLQSAVGDYLCPTVAGFSKRVSGGALTSGHTIASFCYAASAGLSESHNDTDIWLDLWWDSTDGSNNYVDYEGSATLLGRKCLAGYCKSAPVWTMVR